MVYRLALWSCLHEPAWLKHASIFPGDGMEIFKHACTLGCEGIVSKRVGSRHVSGRADNWIKVKNPAAPAVKAEEDGKIQWRSRGRPA